MNTNNTFVAKEIHRQIGQRAFFMLGAMDIVAGEDFLEFKIGLF